MFDAEVVRENQTALRGLQSAVVRAIGPGTTLGSNALVFDLCSRGTDLDPEAEIFTRRITLMRRMRCKWPWVADILREIYAQYRHMGMVGTKSDPTYLKGLCPAPPPAEGMA